MPVWTLPQLTTGGFQTPWGSGAFDPTNATDYNYLVGLVSGTPHVVGGAQYGAYFFSQSRLVGNMSEAAIRAAAQYAADNGKACEASGGKAVECIISVAGHVLQGEYAAKQPTDTAFYWRDSYLIVDATASVPTDLAEAIPAAVPVTSAAIDKFIE